MQKNYIVYEHKNKLNNKRYIGITSQPVKKRWKQGSSYSKKSKIYKAIQKYGWEGFEHNILFSNLTKKQAEKKEITLIKLYNTTSSSCGYNIQNGGSSNGKFTEETKEKISKAKKGKKLSFETRQKMSKSKMGKLHWNYGKKASPETLEKLRISHLGHSAWNKGIKREQWLSKENQEKLKKNQRQAMIGNKHSCKPVKCIETGIIYEGVLDAFKKTGINMSYIGKVCKKEAKTAGGYHWEYIKEKK